MEFGVYLGEKADAKEQERVLLPAKQVPAETKVGDELEVFIYRDSADRLIATTRVPALELHQTAVVKVAEVGKIGAFLDWGLEKDLLLPYKEQTVKVKKDQEVLVALYIADLPSFRLPVPVKLLLLLPPLYSFPLLLPH